jgi:hypothetical protein
LIVVAGVAFLVSLTLRSLPLPEVTDEGWAIEDREKASSAGQVGPSSDLEKKRIRDWVVEDRMSSGRWGMMLSLFGGVAYV